MGTRRVLFVVALLIALMGCEAKKEEKKEAKNAEETPKEAPVEKDKEKEEAPEESAGDEMSAKVARFAVTEIGVAAEKVPAEHKEVLKELVAAAKQIDALFLDQVSNENGAWRDKIVKEGEGTPTLAYFDIMYGPWDRLDADKAFWGEKAKPHGAAFYPEDLTKEEFETFLKANPDQKDALTGYFTVIERDGEGLKAVPYSEAYETFLTPAGAHLEKAASLTKDERLAKYLNSRAAAFKSNDYRPSDMDWMDLGDGDLEVVIGPYEVYEDALMSYKAAYETFITLRDHEASKQLDQLMALLPEMEEFLPIPAEYKNKDEVKESPISVVDVLYSSGDAKAGIQTLAFILPNDTVVREQKGTKKVLLRNIAHAKYDKILIPISKRLMTEAQAANVSFDAFFGHTLVHETAHGLGPKRVAGGATVSEALKDLYPTVEEAKADVLGTYLNYFLVEKGIHDEAYLENVYASFLAGFFRSVRFGATEAHGKANVIQFNYMIERGAIVETEDGKYTYDSSKMRETVKDLAHDVLMLEAEGDYEKAKAFVDKYAVMPDSLKARLDALSDIPTDIKPIYTIEGQLN